MGMSSSRVLNRCRTNSALLMTALLAPACGTSPDVSSIDGGPSMEDLANRAYVISEQSNDLFIVDLETMTEVGRLDTTIRRRKPEKLR